MTWRQDRVRLTDTSLPPSGAVEPGPSSEHRPVRGGLGQRPQEAVPPDPAAADAGGRAEQGAVVRGQQVATGRCPLEVPVATGERRGQQERQQSGLRQRQQELW